MAKAKKRSSKSVKPADLKSKGLSPAKANQVKGGATVGSDMFSTMVQYQSILQKEAAADATLAQADRRAALAAKASKISL